MPDSRVAANPNGLSYRQSGVDIAAGNRLVKAIAPLAAATRRPGADAELGGFGGLFDLAAAGFEDPILVSATDGVGTKLKLAFATGRHDSVGIDLVAMCVNDIVAQGAEPLFFLDYFATGQLDGETAESVISGIAEGCRQAGCALIGGETAEMPGFYDPGHYDLAGFAVGAAERGRLLPRTDMAAGDAVIALPSNGIHSNGFSLVRRLVDVGGLSYEAPCPFDNDATLGEALLAPTRIYARPVVDALRASAPIKAVAHVTGGGITENLPRVLPDGMAARVALPDLPRHPVFGWIAEGGVATDEMLRTFNCGVGMTIIADAEGADALTSTLSQPNAPAIVIGELVPQEGPPAVLYDGAPWWAA